MCTVIKKAINLDSLRLFKMFYCFICSIPENNEPNLFGSIRGTSINKGGKGGNSRQVAPKSIFKRHKVWTCNKTQASVSCQILEYSSLY